MEVSGKKIKYEPFDDKMRRRMRRRMRMPDNNLIDPSDTLNLSEHADKISLKREIREVWMRDLIEKRKEACIEIWGDVKEQTTELENCCLKMMEISRTEKSVYHRARLLIKTYEACEARLAEITREKLNEA